MQHFASDNYAGICPEALNALIAANNSGHEPAYGDDSWTQQVCDRLRDLFQTDCEAFFVFNGHSGQFARPRVAVPVVPLGDLP